MIRNLFLLLLGLTLVSTGGCSSPASSRREPLSAAERDSVLATKSILPGSAVVGRALNIQGRSARMAARLDTKIDSLTR